MSRGLAIKLAKSPRVAVTFTIDALVEDCLQLGMASPIDGQPAFLRFALLCALATVPDPRATADASCLAAAVGGLVAVNATTGRCAPDVCRGSASDVLDLFRETRRPTAAEAAAYAAPRGGRYCDHRPTSSGDAPWRPGTVPASIACAGLYDAAAARSCLAGKRLVFLGDSTLTEVAHGLVMTLIGGDAACAPRAAACLSRDRYLELMGAINHKKRARGARGNRAPLVLTGENATRLQVTFPGPGPAGCQPRGTPPPDGRRFSAALATAGGAVRVDHRWIGHPNVCDPKGGVGLATVAKRNQLKAADLFLDAPDAVDAVIIASGHHDLRLGRYDPAKQSKERAGASKGRETTAEEYAALARQTFDRLGAWRVPASKVFWVSNNRLARCNDGGILGAYDAAAEAEAARRGATFVDVSTPLERHFPQPALTACCGDEVGMHHGFIARGSDRNKSLVASGLEVQRLLGALCAGGGGGAEGGEGAPGSSRALEAPLAARADAPRVEAAARDGLARAVPLVGYDAAVCLDGSPGRYYVDVYGDNTRVYIHLQGGGFCGSLGACANRSRTPLGSTRPDVPGAWGSTLDLAAERPYFSRNATRNPLLADFTHVFVVYCDGAYFAGNVADPAPAPGGDSLFFRGRAILDAVVADLDLAGATDVILGGCSAGGIATFLHLDAVAASLRAIAPAAAVAGFADSGYYADVPYYTSQKRFPFEAQNATADPRCLADHADRPWACLVSSVTASYVRAPLFAWQSRFDADQLATSFAAPCENASCADPYGAALAAGLRAFAARGAAAGAFVDACHRHCDRVDAGHDVWNISAQGTTPLVALADWFSHTRGFLVEQAPNASYPCDSCC